MWLDSHRFGGNTTGKLVTKKSRKEVYRLSSLNGNNPEDTYVPREYLPNVTSEDYFNNKSRNDGALD